MKREAFSTQHSAVSFQLCSILAFSVFLVGCATSPQGRMVQTATAIDAIVMPAARVWADYVKAGFATPKQNAQAEKAYNAYCEAFSLAQQLTIALRAGRATATEADDASAALVKAAENVLAVVKVFLPAAKQANLKLSLTSEP